MGLFYEEVCIMEKELTTEMKKLAEIGKKQGKVLPVSEAFKVYPVEEEVHKGKIDFWNKGDIKREV